MSIPTTQKAIVVQADGSVKVQDADVEQPLPDKFVRVKVHAVGLNPTDWKHAKFRKQEGRLLGCDYSGEVVEVGSNVKSDVKVGDKVCGVVNGSNDERTLVAGTFTSYVASKDGLFAKAPSNISMEEAASLGVGITTCGQALYQSLGLPLFDSPSKESTPVLIYGGSSATGTLAIQYAKLSGLTVYTTCSPHNIDFLKSLGADHVFNYRDSDCASQIRKASDDAIAHVLDCISLESTAKFCGEAMSSKGGIYSALLKVKVPRDDVESKATLAYSAMGSAYNYFGSKKEGSKEDYDFAVKFWKLSAPLLADGKLKPHPIEVRDGGLQSIPQGLKDLEEDKVSGKKLIYKIA